MMYNLTMKKDIVYSIRMANLVRDTLRRAATKERRTVASLLDKIILNYLEEQRYLLPHETGNDRRVHQRSKITLPAMTIMENGYKNSSYPCVITDIAMGGVNITYPKGSQIRRFCCAGRMSSGFYLDFPKIHWKSNSSAMPAVWWRKTEKFTSVP